jgi:hypothetical protein
MENNILLSLSLSVKIHAGLKSGAGKEIFVGKKIEIQISFDVRFLKNLRFEVFDNCGDLISARNQVRIDPVRNML